MYFFFKSGYKKCTFSEKMAMKNVIFFEKSLFFFVYLHFEKQSKICIEIL